MHGSLNLKSFICLYVISLQPIKNIQRENVPGPIQLTSPFLYFPFNHCAVKARKESRNNGYEKEEKPPKCIFACLLCFIPLKQKKPTKTRTVQCIIGEKNLKEGHVG